MSIPSTNDIALTIQKSIVAPLKEVDSTFDPSLQRVNISSALSIGMAPAVRTSYIYSLSAAAQSNPLRADSIRDNPSIGQLESWGVVSIKRLPFQASRGRYEIEVKGDGTISRGTVLVNQVNQEVYTVDLDYTITQSATISITASNVGDIPRLNIGDTLFFTQAVPGINTDAIVRVETQEPVNEEDTEEYRSKILQKMFIRSRGGSIGDMVLYGLEIDGVNNIYPYSGNLLGSAKIYIKADKAISAEGIPPASLIEDVKRNIILKANMQSPLIDFLPIVRRKYIIEIAGLSNINQKPIIEKVVNEYFEGKEPFIDSVTLETKKNINLILSSQVFGNVLNAIQPEIITRLTMKVENVIPNGFVRTKDLSTVTTLFGPTSSDNGSFTIKKDGGVARNITINGHLATNIIDYVLLIGQNTLQYGIRTNLIQEGAKYYIKFESDTVGSNSTIEITSGSTGVDLTSATYLDIGNSATVKETGGTSNVIEVDSERLPQGNIPYVGEIKYV